MIPQQLFIRSTFNYDGFPEYAAQQGVNVQALREELGLEPEVFDRQMSFVPWNAICRFYESAAKEIKDPNLGIRYALEARSDFSAIGPVIYLGALSDDIRSFFKSIETYQSIRTNGLIYSIEEKPEHNEVIGRYKIHEASARYDQLLESTLALAAITARKLVPGFQVKYASFTHKAPPDTSLYTQVFDAPVHFEAEENRLVSDMRYYDLDANKLTVGFRDFALKAYFNGRLKLTPDARHSMTSFIEAILPTVIGTGTSDVESFAKSVNMHPKKLQRLVKDEGSSFSNIRDDIRQQLASSLLLNTDLSVSHIASLLDYSSDRPFTTAFKRWYDLSPS